MKRLAVLVVLAAAACGSPSGTCTDCTASQVCDPTTNTCVAAPLDASGSGRDATAAGQDATHCSCDNKECGDDGCGTECGPCGNGLSCEAFQCIPVPRDAGHKDGGPRADVGTAPAADVGTPDTGNSPGLDAAAPERDASQPKPDAGPIACTGPLDCPIGQACDLTMGQCVTYCGPTQPCNGGCCAGNGQCHVESDTTCGTTSCLDCTMTKEGRVCVGNVCGCQSEKDCPVAQSCDPTKQACTSACVPKTQPCNNTCCDSFVCRDLPSACGPTCTNCTAPLSNHACVSGVCGCTLDTDCATGSTCDQKSHLCTTCATDQDCPVGMACNPLSHACSTSCTSTCNGACCLKGTCANVDVACGPTCTNCSVLPTQPKCMASGTCGCASAADCPVGQACSGGLCGTYCEPLNGVTCNQGCCLKNTCTDGSAQAACGGNGRACVTCSVSQVCCDSNAPNYLCEIPKLCLLQ